MQPVKWLAALVVAFAVTRCFGANEADFEEYAAPIVDDNDFAYKRNRNEENKLEEELKLATETVSKQDSIARSPDEPEGVTSFEDTYQEDDNLEEATVEDGDPSKEPDQTSEYLQQEPIVYEEEEEAALENDEEEDEAEFSDMLDDTGELQYSPADNEEFIEAFGEDDTKVAYEPTAQVMREPLVGVGYHIINGNPDGSFLDGGRDPGLLRTRRIMRLTFTDGKSTNLRGTRQRVADQVKFVRADSCSTSQVTKMIYGVSSYRSKLSASVSASYRSGHSGHDCYNNWYNYYSYSHSSGYRSVRAQTTASRKVFMDKTSHCHVGVARYMMESVPHSNNFGVSRSFYHAFLSLPEKGNQSSYHQFIDQWGTHIVVKATLGGRRIDRYRASVDQLYSYAESRSRSSVHVGSSHGSNHYRYYYRGHHYSNYLYFNTRSFNRRVNSKTQIGRSFTQLNIGSHIDYNKKQHRWQIPITDTNIPEATKIEIIPISSVCDHVGYWTCIPEAKLTNVQIQNLLRKRCVNLMKSANTYAKYLKLKKEKDPSLNLPLVWPEGTYALPKAKSGCPKGQGFDFVSGWRRHDTENYRTTNIHSSPIHLDGYFGQNIRTSFCTKRTPQANRKYRRKHWPRGSYCLYKKGNCPIGFKHGYIYWDDENSRNTNSKKGILPDGRYDKNTLIRFCCRHDGSSRDPIALPTSTPFYLLRYGGRCQTVLGMKVRDEFVRWDDENYRNADSHGGSHPDDKFPDHMIHFCYYHK